MLTGHISYQGRADSISNPVFAFLLEFCILSVLIHFTMLVKSIAHLFHGIPATPLFEGANFDHHRQTYYETGI